MKKGNAWLLIVMICGLMLFAGCAEGDEAHPRQLSIFKGVSSYSLFSEDADVIGDLYYYLETLEYEETDAESDIYSEFLIVFSFASRSAETFHIDKNGVLRLDDEEQCYQIVGDFDYDYIESVYRTDGIELSQGDE